MTEKIFFIVLFLFSATINAQFNSQYNRGGIGGGRFQQRQPTTTAKQKPPSFNIEKAVGMTFYNSEKVIKKIGLKKSSEIAKVTTNIIEKFNKDLNQLKRINTFLFSEAKNKIESAQREAFELRDYVIFQKAYKDVTTIFKPVVKVVKEKEEKLN